MDRRIYPVNAMLAHLAVRKGQAWPLFITKQGRGFTRQMFSSALDALLTHLKLDCRIYNTHSFRTRTATFAVRVRIPHCQIKILGCWQSDAYQCYVKTPARLSKKLASQLELLPAQWPHCVRLENHETCYTLFYICIIHATHAHLICYFFISTHCNTKESRVSIITADKLQVRDHTYHSLLGLKVPPPTSDPSFCGWSMSNLEERKISWCWIQPNPKTCCFKSQNNPLYVWTQNTGV